MTIFSFVGEEWNVSQPPPLHKNLELALRIKKVNWDTKQTPVSQDCSLKTQDLKIINKFLILGDRTSHTKACVEGLSHWWYCGAPPPGWRIPRTTFPRGLVSRRARPQPARERGPSRVKETRCHDGCTGLQHGCALFLVRVRTPSISHRSRRGTVESFFSSKIAKNAICL